MDFLLLVYIFFFDQTSAMYGSFNFFFLQQHTYRGHFGQVLSSICIKIMYRRGRRCKAHDRFNDRCLFFLFFASINSINNQKIFFMILNYIILGFYLFIFISLFENLYIYIYIYFHFVMIYWRIKST